MKLTIVLFLFIGGFMAAKSQNTKVDSIQQLIYESKNAKVSKKIELYDKLIILKINSSIKDNIDADIDTLAALHLANNDSISYYNTLYNTKAVWLCKFISETGKALVLYQKYISTMKIQQLSDSINPYIYIDVGNLYYKLGIYESAWRYYKIAVDVFEKIKNENGVFTSYQNLALVALQQNKFDTAYFYVDKLNEVMDKKDTFLLTQQLNVRISIQKAEKKYEGIESIGLHCINLLKTQYKNTNNPKLNNYVSALAYIYFQMADIKYDLGKNKSSLLYLDSALLHLKKYEILYDNLNPAIWDLQVKNYQKLGQIDKAINYALKILETTQEPNDVTSTGLVMYDNLYNLYKEKQDKNKMYKFGFLYHELNVADKINIYDEKLLWTNNLILQLENEQTINEQQFTIKDKENKQKEQEKIRYYLLLALFLAAIIVFIVFYFIIKLSKQNKIIKSYSIFLQQSNKDKELLLSVIGHDIRSPFQSIFNNIDKVYNYFDVAKQSPVLQNLAQAKKSAEQVFVLLDNLLQWVLVQKENINIENSKINLTELLTGLNVLFKNMALLEHLQINVAKNLPILYTDKSLVLIIFRNLLLNAIKYSKTKSTIYINHQIVDNQCFINIVNEVDFVSAALIYKINAYKEKQELAFKGSGLGLKLVDEIAQKIGFQIQIFNSQENQICSKILIPLSVCELQNTENEELEVKKDIKKNIEKLKLTAKEKVDWEILLAELQTCEIYESSKIKYILNNSLINNYLQLSFWKKELLEAARNLDEIAFFELLQNINIIFDESSF